MCEMISGTDDDDDDDKTRQDGCTALTVVIDDRDDWEIYFGRARIFTFCIYFVHKNMPNFEANSMHYGLHGLFEL